MTEETAVTENNTETEELESQEEGLEVIESEEEQETETEEAETAEAGEEESESEEEMEIVIGEESPPQEEKNEAPQWVRDLRKENKELKRQLKKAEKVEQPEPEMTLRAMPAIDDDDIDFDTVKHKEEMDKWLLEKQAYDSEQSAKQQSQKQAEEEWNQKLDSYNEAKAKLNVKDFEDAELNVADKLSIEQQSIIVKYAAKPELLMYAIGSNDQRLEELSKEKDLLKFAMLISKLEGEVKMRPRKTPPPEKKVAGKGGSISDPEKKLAELEAEADRTGNRTKLLKYKKELKQARNS